MTNEPVRVLLVDDSAVARGIMASALETDPGIVVAGTAIHGEAALRTLAKYPVDVVVLDVEMPVMDGIQTLLRIRADYPGVHVIMASALTVGGADVTIRALNLGAADCIAKPQTGKLADSIRQVADQLVPLVKELGRARTRTASRTPASVAPIRVKGPAVMPDVVIIGTSTGGPNALTKLLTALPVDFPLPILIVQHMPPLFTPLLARHLGRETGRPCQEAVDGEVIDPGKTYIAPGDYHLFIENDGGCRVTRLNQDEPEHFCRPSVNPLFRSAADCYGSGVLGVILTGMGSDGLEGTRRVVECRGYVIAQDEQSSVVWGMPGAVVRDGLANQVLPLDQVAGEIQRLCQHLMRKS